MHVMYMYATVIHLELDGILDNGVEVNTNKFSSQKIPNKYHYIKKFFFY